jgi:hypothetical protein
VRPKRERRNKKDDESESGAAQKQAEVDAKRTPRTGRSGKRIFELVKQSSIIERTS